MPRTQPTLTERKLAGMLKENTGKAMMDSGGAYGRHWQRNQARDFMSEAATVLAPVADYVADGSAYEPEVTHNVFHFLATACDYDAAMNRKYQTFARKRRNDTHETEIMEEFTAHLAAKGERVGGIYGDGEPFAVNTYNGEDLLSQTLQYRYFSVDRVEYVLLQIHGGCDVRGGYTDAVAFQAGDDSGTAIYDNAKATIYTLDDPEYRAQLELLPDAPKTVWDRAFWTTDDGWHWYFQGGSPSRSLRDYTISRDPAHRGDGEHVWIDADGAAHCPQTGLKLAAGY